MTTLDDLLLKRDGQIIALRKQVEELKAKIAELERELSLTEQPY